ncbi:glycosyltransferase family 4 protein, partial [Gemmatimonadota bacterium]
VHYRLSRNIWAMAPAARLAGLNGRVVHTLGMNPGGRLNNPVHNWLRNTLGAFVAPTPVTAAKAARVWGMGDDEVTVIPNFVTTAPFESADLDRDATALRASWGIPAGSRLVGTLARLEPAKGIDTFVRAAISILQTAAESTSAFAPGSDLYFIAGGPVKKDWKPWLNSLRESVASAGYSDRIIFPGHQDNVPAFMKSLDLFVLPSPKETFGIVLLEAMISGRAVIACGGPGPDYILDSGEAGLLVEPDDHDGMSQAILSLLGNDERRDRLAMAGQARVRTNFTDEVVLPAYEELFDRVRTTD